MNCAQVQKDHTGRDEHSLQYEQDHTSGNSFAGPNGLGRHRGHEQSLPGLVHIFQGIKGIKDQDLTKTTGHPKDGRSPCSGDFLLSGSSQTEKKNQKQSQEQGQNESMPSGQKEPNIFSGQSNYLGPHRVSPFWAQDFMHTFPWPTCKT